MANQFVQKMKDRGFKVDARVMAYVAANPDELCSTCDKPCSYDPVQGSYRHNHDGVLRILCEDEPD